MDAHIIHASKEGMKPLPMFFFSHHMDIIHLDETLKDSAVVEDGLFSAGSGYFRWRPPPVCRRSLGGPSEGGADGKRTMGTTGS